MAESSSPDAEELPLAPRRRNFSPWYSRMVQLARVREEDPLPENASPAVLEEWRRRARGRLHDLLGPLPERVPLELEVRGEVRCEGYRRFEVVFDSEDSMSVPAFLLVPEQRSKRGPAVVAVHGHGPGKSQVCAMEFTDAPGSDYGHQLATRGYVVLAPDLRCFGERADWNPPDHYGCDTNLVHGVMAGRSPLTENLWDLARCIDVLEEHPLVDPARVAVAGLSYGGTMSLFLAAWDPRVCAAVVSGYFSSWAESHKMPWNMCGSQVLPGMLGRLEHADLAALVAPRPLLVESGEDDDLFPAAVAAAELDRVRPVYELSSSASGLESSGRLVHDRFAGGHQWHGDVAYDFLERWIGPGDEQ